MMTITTQRLHRSRSRPAYARRAAAWRAGEVLASLCRPVNGPAPLSKTNARAFVGGGRGEKSACSNPVRQCGKKPLYARRALSDG
jgi:hypothetical protein